MEFSDGLGGLLYLGIILSAIPFVFVGSNFLVTDVIWFCFLYLIGAYIKHNEDKLNNTWKTKLYFIVLIFCMWMTSIVINKVYEITQIEKVKSYIFYFSTTYSPFMLISGILLFILFKNMKMFNEFINKLGSVPFSCYLLHDNGIARVVVWNNIFHTEKFYDESILFI